MSNPFGPPGQPGPGEQNPYGQQPPYGGPPPQPYGGQPPYPGPPPQQPGWGPPPMGPQPYAGQMGYVQPRRRKKWPWIVGGIVGVIVILGVIGYFVGKDEGSNAKVGDCITSDKRPKITDCADADAAFRVIGKFEDTTSQTRCQTPELLAKGHFVAIAWEGADTVICATLTRHTTVEDFRYLTMQDGSAMDQATLDDAREQLAVMGIEGVK